MFTINFPDGGFLHRNEFDNKDGSASYSIQNGATAQDAFESADQAKAVADKMGLTDYEVKPLVAEK